MKHFLGIAEWNDWDIHEMAKLLAHEGDRWLDPTKHAEAWKIEFWNRKIKQNEDLAIYLQEMKRMVIKHTLHYLGKHKNNRL